MCTGCWWGVLIHPPSSIVLPSQSPPPSVVRPLAPYPPVHCIDPSIPRTHTADRHSARCLLPTAIPRASARCPSTITVHRAYTPITHHPSTQSPIHNHPSTTTHPPDPSTSPSTSTGNTHRQQTVPWPTFSVVDVGRSRSGEKNNEGGEGKSLTTCFLCTKWIFLLYLFSSAFHHSTVPQWPLHHHCNVRRPVECMEWRVVGKSAEAKKHARHLLLPTMRTR